MAFTFDNGKRRAILGDCPLAGNFDDVGQGRAFFGEVLLKRSNVLRGSFDVDGDAGRGVGHVTLQAILGGELKYKRPKADPLNNTIHFQPFGNTSFCHYKREHPVTQIRDFAQ